MLLLLRPDVQHGRTELCVDNVTGMVYILHIRKNDSWQNDIYSFRAMTVALTVSFKLISF